MDPDVRSAALIAGLVFCAAFGIMTLAVAVKDGPDILTLASLLILAMIGSGLIGAIRNPPNE